MNHLKGRLRPSLLGSYKKQLTDGCGYGKMELKREHPQWGDLLTSSRGNPISSYELLVIIIRYRGKNMKKICSILLIIIIIIISLCGCASDPATYYFSKNAYINEIESIELVKYNNEAFEMVDASKETLKFDYEKVETLETLDVNKIDAFLEDFEEIVFHVENDSVNEPVGYCLLWYLKNGNFIVFSCTLIKKDRGYSMVAEFDSTGKFIQHSVASEAAV